MMVLITYDINTESETGKKRLRKAAKQCINYGQRVQNSVFECLIDPGQFKILQNKLLKIIDLEKDSIRYYYLGDEWKRRVEHIGRKTSYDIEGPLIV